MTSVNSRLLVPVGVADAWSPVVDSAETVAAGPQAEGWIVRTLPVAFAAASALLLVGGLGGVMRYAFPAGAVVTGALLCRTSAPAFLAFAWWIWFLTPGVRRIIDYQAGWAAMNLVSLTPLLVSGLVGFSLFRRLPRLRWRALQPFNLIAISLLYGYVVGIARIGFSAATYTLLLWMVPLLLGLYLAMHPERYDENRDALERTFSWGLLVLGGYGIAQFLAPLPWDRSWMLNSRMGVIGVPEPFQVRVFSLLNSPGVLAPVLAAGILLLFSGRHRLRIPAMSLATVALLLSLVRSTWLGAVMGMAVLLAYTPLRGWRRPAIGLTALGVALSIAMASAPTESVQPIVEAVRNRVESLTDLSQDDSYNGRARLLEMHLASIATSPLGRGLGSTGEGARLEATGEGRVVFDNGVLELFHNLGWYGGTAFTLGLIWLLAALVRRSGAPGDPFPIGARAAIATLLFQTLAGNAFVGATGAALWCCLGLVIASREQGRMRPQGFVPGEPSLLPERTPAIP
jgi:hypothetical protein